MHDINKEIPENYNEIKQTPLDKKSLQELPFEEVMKLNNICLTSEDILLARPALPNDNISIENFNKISGIMESLNKEGIPFVALAFKRENKAVITLSNTTVGNGMQYLPIIMAMQIIFATQGKMQTCYLKDGKWEPVIKRTDDNCLKVEGYDVDMTPVNSKQFKNN